MYPDIKWQAVGQAVAVVGLCWLLSLTSCAPPPLPPGAVQVSNCSIEGRCTWHVIQPASPPQAYVPYPAYDNSGALLGLSAALLNHQPTAPAMTNCYGTSRNSLTCLSY